jgi:Radical SAM superfamily
MRVGVISAYQDYHRKGAHHRGILQPQVGALIAALLPSDVEIEVTNDTSDDPPWNRDYDLLFLSSLHSDFDRARQISHYWRTRGAKTVYGGTLASTYPQLCLPFFDSVVVGDPETTVGRIYDDFCRNALEKMYVSSAHDPGMVPVPRFDLLARSQMAPLSLEATRGCPFSCEFCALTGIGTRYHSRPIDAVIRDIREGQHLIRGLAPAYKRRIVVFNDNNLGGSPAYLRQFCAALKPMRLFWGGAVTFNIVADRSMVELLSEAGCRFLFIGLESFNQEVLADMGKFQNVIEKTRLVLDQCRECGIVVESGLMISPALDSCASMRTIPASLRECGLHVPSFICFEAPIPGTPHFQQLAAEEKPAFLPNALLRDFTGYTLVTRPKLESVERFIQMYRWLLEEVYTRRNRMRKLRDDLPRFIVNKRWAAALADVFNQTTAKWNPHPDRTYLAGTDTPPPEATSVPFEPNDFRTEEERRAILEPYRVTDGYGRILPEWLGNTKVFEPKGRISIEAAAWAR